MQNPRFSYPVVAKLDSNKLNRIPQTGSPAPDETIGNLDFGTSNMCCDYAPLHFNTPASLSFSARTSPFYVDAAGYLVWEQPQYRNHGWFLCVKGAQKFVGFPCRMMKGLWQWD